MFDGFLRVLVPILTGVLDLICGCVVGLCTFVGVFGFVRILVLFGRLSMLVSLFLLVGIFCAPVQLVSSISNIKFLFALWASAEECDRPSPLFLGLCWEFESIDFDRFHLGVLKLLTASFVAVRIF